MYNFITNIQTCQSAISEMLSGNSAGILYYSHIPTAIVALLIGIFVFIKDSKSLVSKVLLSLSAFFSIWSVLDLFTWVSYDSRVIMWTWSLTGIFDVLLFIASLYFIYVFIN